MCVFVWVMLELKGFSFGVRFLVDEGSRPGSSYYMQQNIDGNYNDGY
jgi:hypothetical protein